MCILSDLFKAPSTEYLEPRSENLDILSSIDISRMYFHNVEVISALSK